MEEKEQAINFYYIFTLQQYREIFADINKTIETQKIKLLVLDNLSSLCDNFTKADGSVDYIERSQFLVKHAIHLKKLAEQFGLHLVIVNNVVSDMNSG